MSLAVYVTVPFERTRILSGSSRPANSSDSDSRSTQQPAWRPPSRGRVLPEPFSISKARSQKFFREDVALAGKEVVRRCRGAPSSPGGPRRSRPPRRPRSRAVSLSPARSRGGRRPATPSSPGASRTSADLRVEVPAEIGETLSGWPRRRPAARRRRSTAPASLGRRDALEMEQARRRRRRPERRCRRGSSAPRPRSRVTAALRTSTSPEHRVAQVPDVGRLVGVDVGVLDDHLARSARGGRGRRERSPATNGAAVEPEVDVPAALDADLRRIPCGSARPRRAPRRSRGARASRASRELEGGGRREVAQRDPRRPFEDDPVEGDEKRRRVDSSRLGSDRRRRSSSPRERIHGRGSIVSAAAEYMRRAFMPRAESRELRG